LLLLICTVFKSLKANCSIYNLSELEVPTPPAGQYKLDVEQLMKFFVNTLNPVP